MFTLCGKVIRAETKSYPALYEHLSDLLLSTLEIVAV